MTHNEIKARDSGGDGGEVGGDGDGGDGGGDGDGGGGGGNGAGVDSCDGGGDGGSGGGIGDGGGGSCGDLLVILFVVLVVFVVV